jgi:hypothetical protein
LEEEEEEEEDAKEEEEEEKCQAVCGSRAERNVYMLHLEPTTLATLGAHYTGYTWSPLHWLHFKPSHLARSSKLCCCPLPFVANTTLSVVAERDLALARKTLALPLRRCSCALSLPMCSSSF